MKPAGTNNDSIIQLELDVMWTAKELEAILKIDVKTIYGYVQRGLIPYIRIQSNVRFLRSQISDWLTHHNYIPKKLNSKTIGKNPR
jgi:predicted DNA-binding transcriptional regulator AlpA